MFFCKHCRAPIHKQRDFLSGAERWVDGAAVVCGAFCPARDGQAHEPTKRFEVTVTVTVDTTYAVPVEADTAEEAEAKIRAALETEDVTELDDVRQVSDYPEWISDTINAVVEVQS